MTDTARYTLDEARTIIAKRTCAMVDHDYEILQALGRGPTAIVCARCGESWTVATATNQEKP